MKVKVTKTRDKNMKIMLISYRITDIVRRTKRKKNMKMRSTVMKQMLMKMMMRKNMAMKESKMKDMDTGQTVMITVRNVTMRIMKTK